MTVASTVSPQGDTGVASTRPTVDWRRAAPPVAVLSAIAIVGLALGHTPPTWLDIHLKPWVDSLYRWSQLHGDRNWLFRFVFTPFAHAVTWMTKSLLSGLRWIRWPGVLALTALVGWRTSGVRAAAIGALVLAGCGVLGFWDDTLITASIMLVAVAISLVIGIPLGIWAGLSDRAERILRAFLDTAQVMPPYVYLLPLVVAFGIGIPPAVVATVIYAVPPAARLTSLGIREVAGTTTEVGTSFGCTRWQLLLKVQLPLARRAILLGINQVIRTRRCCTRTSGRRRPRQTPLACWRSRRCATCCGRCGASSSTSTPTRPRTSGPTRSVASNGAGRSCSAPTTRPASPTSDGPA